MAGQGTVDRPVPAGGAAPLGAPSAGRGRSARLAASGRRSARFSSPATGNTHDVDLLTLVLIVLIVAVLAGGFGYGGGVYRGPGIGLGGILLIILLVLLLSGR